MRTNDKGAPAGNGPTQPRHPSQAELARFLRAELPRADEARVRSHLAAGCVYCLRARHRLVYDAHQDNQRRQSLALADPPPGDRSALLLSLGRRIERVVWLEALEEEVGAALLGELQRRPRQEHREWVRENDRYHLLGFARFLTARARTEVYCDVSAAVDLGELAVEVAEALDPRVYLPGAITEAGLRAWCACANARRVATDLPGAERAFVVAGQRLEATGSESARLEYLSLIGSLRIAQARFEEARSTLTRARSLASRLREAEGEARVVLKLAKAYGEGGHPAAAVALLDSAVTLFEQQPREELTLFARHARAWWLIDIGRPTEAKRELRTIRAEWSRQAVSAGDRLRLDWLRARIDWAEGHRETAEHGLLAVRDAFGREALHYDYALACLDLAVFYLEEGRTAEVRHLSEEMHPVFASRELHRHALAAVALFQSAAAAERATAAWVRQVARYLKHARENPSLRFDTPGP